MKHITFIVATFLLLCNSSIAVGQSIVYNTVNVSEYYYATAFRIDSNEDGQYVLAIAVEPVGSSAFISSGSVDVEQNGRSYDILLNDPLDLNESQALGFQGTIYREKRVFLYQRRDDQKYDDQDSLTLVFRSNSGAEVRLIIPASPGYNKLKASSYNSDNQILTIPYVEVGSEYYFAELFYNGRIFELRELVSVDAPN